MRLSKDEKLARSKRRLTIQTNALGPLTCMTCIPWGKLGWLGLLVQLIGLFGLLILLGSFLVWRDE